MCVCVQWTEHTFFSLDPSVASDCVELRVVLVAGRFSLFLLLLNISLIVLSHSFRFFFLFIPLKEALLR